MDTKKLKKQKAEFDKKYYQLGMDHAVEDAPDLDYEDFISIENTKNPIEIYELPVYGNVLDERREDDKNFCELEYLRGWRDGILKIFEIVKPKLQ